MKKKQSPIKKLSQNFKNLVPYIGVLFVMAGIVGLLFIQKPLQTSQDTRSDASSGNEYILRNCGETCTTNRDCAINLRCYEGACRLAINPTSPSCSATNEAEIEKTEDTSTHSAVAKTEPTKTNEDNDTPTKKGDNLLTDPDLEFKKQQNALAERKAYDESYQADETLLGLFKNMILNPESRLPFFIILFGIMLLVITIFAALITRLRKTRAKTKYSTQDMNKKIKVKSYAVKPGEAPRNRAAKDLLKTLENQPKA